MCGAVASILSALDVIHVDLDNKGLICAIVAMLCGAFVVVCGLAWRLHRGAIVALCSGYLIVGLMLGLQCALTTVMPLGVVGHERQLAGAAMIALACIVAGVATHRQIAVLDRAS